MAAQHSPQTEMSCNKTVNHQQRNTYSPGAASLLHRVALYGIVTRYGALGLHLAVTAYCLSLLFKITLIGMEMRNIANKHVCYL